MNEWTSFVTVILSVLGSAVTIWISFRTHWRAAAKADLERSQELEKLEQKRKEDLDALENKLRSEQIASQIAQAQIEVDRWNGVQSEINRVRQEATVLRSQLNAAEEENRRLKIKVFELELELTKLQTIHQSPNVVFPAPGQSVTITSKSLKKETLEPVEGLDKTKPSK